MDNISLANDHQDGVLSLKSTKGPQFPQDHLDDLSLKYDSSMGPASPGPISIQSMISTNNQSRLGELLSQQKGVELEGARNEIIQQIANNAGGVPTQQDIAAVRSLSEQQIYSPNVNSTLEEQYAKQVTNTQLETVNQNTDSAYDASITSAPGMTNQILDRSEFMTARNMISNNALVDLRQKFDNSNIFQKGLAFAQTFVPFRTWAQMNNFLDQKDLATTSILPGDRMRDQIAWLHTLAPSEYKAKLQEGIDKFVSSGDYLDAIQFVEATLAFGDDDKNWQNIFAGLDVASVVPAGTIVKALKGSSRVVNVALKDAEVAAKVTGAEGQATRVAASEALLEGKLPLTNIKKSEDVERALMSISRPAEVFSGTATKASAAVQGRLQTSMMSRASRALEILMGTNKVDRLTPLEVKGIVDSTMIDMRRDFSDQSSNLVNIRQNVPDNVTNINSVTAEFGKKDGSWFSDEKGAKAWGTRVLGNKTGDWQAVEDPKGMGWRVEVTRNIDESKAGARDFTIETSSKNADNFLSRFIPFLMGADTKLSEAQQIARSSVVMSVEKQQHLLTEFGRPIMALRLDKAGFKEWNKFLKASRDRVDPERGRGVTYHTLSEFEDAWYTQYNKLPTEAQSDAYLSYHQAEMMHHIVNALDTYKQRAILGIEKFSAKRMILKDDKKTLFDPLDFEGKAVDRLPWGGSRFRVAVLDEDGVLMAGTKSDSKFILSDTDKEFFDKKIADGYTVVQAYDGAVQVGEGHFNYVLMKNFRRDRIDMNLSFKNRLIQKYPYYIKQGKFNISGGRAWYNGDVALANARDAEDGRFILDKMETARKMMKEQAAQGNKFRKSYPAKDYFEQHLPMWDYADFTKSVADGKINLNTPFSLTRGGARTVDSGDNLLARLRDEGHVIDQIETNDNFRLSNQVRGRFLGETSETNMKTWGVEKDSIFELATDSTLSPLETLKMSMGDMIDVNVMNDYKIRSVRDFTEQFGHLLAGDKLDYAHNGLKYIFNPVYKTGISEAEKKGAEAVRKAILNLWQHSTPVDRAIGVYKEQIVRTLRNSFGDNVAEWANDKGLPGIMHTDRFMRAVAFHSKMGFFNPKQLFLQASSAVQIGLISPKFGTKAAMLTSPIMFGLKANSEEILKGMGAKLAGTMGIPADDYVELIGMYKRSGFDLVGGDVAYIDDLSPPKLTQGKIGQVLQWGTTPFRIGERTARSMAFATAYLERKAASKLALSRADEQWILKRAKDLTGNMTRDSNAPYQQGYTAIATQFFGYQMRLFEQMWGSKLSLAEKGRLMAGMSMMYGVPVGLGMTLGVVPVREWFKGEMAKDGVDLSNPIAEPFVDGIAASILKVISGTEFDVAGRYGPNGINNFGDLMTGDASFFNLIMGASGGTIFNTAADFDPIIRGIGSMLNPNEVQKFPIVAQDWLQPLSEITTANSFIKLWKAQNIGAWVSKNENKLTDINTIEAAIGATLGLDPQRVSDAFTQIDVINKIKDQQSADEKAMIADFRRGVQAMKSGNNDLAVTYYNRVKVRGHSSGFTEKQFQQMYHRAMQDESLDESVMKQFQKLGEQLGRTKP